jgi:hypothetical protein
MGLEQFLGAGFVAALAGVIGAFFTYAQATKVADSQSRASVGVKRLENENNVQNLFHQDLIQLREELRAERGAHLDCIRICARFESECKRLTDENADLESENVDLRAQNLALDHRNRQLQTIADGFEWIKTRPDVLRRMADEVEE